VSQNVQAQNQTGAIRAQIYRAVMTLHHWGLICVQIVNCVPDDYGLLRPPERASKILTYHAMDGHGDLHRISDFRCCCSVLVDDIEICTASVSVGLEQLIHILPVPLQSSTREVVNKW